MTEPGFRFRSDHAGVETYRTVQTLEALSARYDIPVDAWVKLNQNENAYGSSPEAYSAMAEIQLHRYPDSFSTDLCAALSEYCGVSPDRFVCGNGGDEIIDVLFRLFMDPEDEAITCPPTFGFYSVAAKLNRARLLPVPRDSAFDIDPIAIAAALTPRTKLILLCNPNNPTANSTSESDLRRVLDIGVPVMLDEAYFEFAGHTHLALQDEYPHLMVIRTFSKWAGLASLRIGYGIFSTELAKHVRAIRPAYTVNGAAQAAATASIRDREARLAVVARVRSDRDALVSGINQTAVLRALPSETNFIYCIESGAGSAGWVYEELLKRGVIVRLFASPDAVRITVGMPSENTALLAALSDIALTVSRETVEGEISLP